MAYNRFWLHCSRKQPKKWNQLKKIILPLRGVWWDGEFWAISISNAYSVMCHWTPSMTFWAISPYPPYKRNYVLNLHCWTAHLADFLFSWRCWSFKIKEPLVFSRKSNETLLMWLRKLSNRICAAAVEPVMPAPLRTVRSKILYNDHWKEYLSTNLFFLFLLDTPVLQ